MDETNFIVTITTTIDGNYATGGVVQYVIPEDICHTYQELKLGISDKISKTLAETIEEILSQQHKEQEEPVNTEEWLELLE